MPFGASPGTVALFFQMETVQEAVEYRGEDDAGDAKQGYAAVNGVYTSEQLAVECRDRVHRPHAGKYHCGIDECVYPRHMFVVMIPLNGRIIINLFIN